MLNKSLNTFISKNKWSLFIISLFPLLRLFYLGWREALGANPIEYIERSLGTWALVFLLITLSITPMRKWFGLSALNQHRRMFGLYMFFYGCLHIVTYLWLDHWFDYVEIFKDVIKHPYVLVGFAAFMLSIPLALTSTNAMMRRLGGRWKVLHQLIYIISVFVLLHFLWLVKKDHTEPLVYTGVFILLIALRIMYKFRHNFRL